MSRYDGSWVGSNGDDSFQAHKKSFRRWGLIKRWGNWVLSGVDGNDTLIGGGNSDTIYGGNGIDILDGKDGNDLIYGGNDTDHLQGWEGNDTLYGGNGSDGIGGWNGDDLIYGQSGDDTIYGDFGNDFIDGGSGNDLLIGTTSNESVFGYDYGNDTLIGNGGRDTLIGGNGDDALDSDIVSSVDLVGDILDGGSGNDTLRGEGGNDTLTGGRDNDLLIGTDTTVNGVGERDILTSGSYVDRDRFVLGEYNTVYYLDRGTSFNSGNTSYARITDFDITNFFGERRTEVDIIQLEGRASDYRLGTTTVSGQSGVGIYKREGSTFSSSDDDLIALVQGSDVSSSTLNLYSITQFDYV